MFWATAAMKNCSRTKYGHRTATMVISLFTGSLRLAAILAQKCYRNVNSNDPFYTELDHFCPAVRIVPLSHCPDGATAILSGATACSLVR
jgi:hypothetical protein